MKIKIILILFLLVLSSCARTQKVKYYPIGPPGDSKKDPGEIIVFHTKKPDREYRELGIIKIITWKYLPDEMKYINTFKEKAAEIGADAIIILEAQTETATNYVTKQTYQGKVYRAMAISYDNKEKHKTI